MKNIGIDLDDVLLGFNEAFTHFHNLNYGTAHTRAGITNYYMERVWGVTPEDIRTRLNSFYYSTEHEAASPIDGAIEGIDRLAKNNSLHIVTASPEEIKERIAAWLGKHFKNEFKSIHFTRKTLLSSKRNKKEICKELGIEVFIDDSISNAEDIASINIPVYLLDSPWNQGETSPLIKRVYSWKEIIKELA